MENERKNAIKNKIEITTLIEFLQDEIEEAAKVPFSTKVMVDKKIITQLIDDIMKNVPEDFKTAQYVITEKERILEEANLEYKRIKDEANEVMKTQVNNHTIVREAEARAKEIIAKAQLEAKNMRLASRDYADSLLSDLEKEMEEKSKDALIAMHKSFEEFTNSFQTSMEESTSTIRENIKELQNMK